MLRAVATVDGVVVGTWSRKGLDLFAGVPASAANALADEVRRIAVAGRQ
jgi:hypothetical protein